MAEITISQAWTWILTIAAGVITLSKLWDIVRERMKPQKKLKEEVAHHTDLIAKDKEHLEQMLVGNLFITGRTDEEGNLTSLTDKDVKYIERFLMLEGTERHPEPHLMLDQVEYAR